MSKTSDRAEVLSVAIARHFEKEPTWTKGRMDGRDHLSDGGWWWCEKGSIGDHLQRNHALDISRPEIAMRLLKELLAKYKECRFGQHKDGSFYVIPFYGGEQYEGASLELAIAEAFAKAVGLEVE